jgi:segregation and condensation protein B
MNKENELQRRIEAALFASSKALDENALIKLFPEGAQPSLGEVREALNALIATYDGRGVILKKIASGYRFQVAFDVAPDIQGLWQEKPQRNTRAFLETLALIAYRQPITRAEIEDIRGVQVSSNIIRQLLELEWIRVVGHKEVPGKPELFATTKGFLDHFSLETLEALPPLSALRDLDLVARDLEANMAKTAEAQRSFANSDGLRDNLSEVVISIPSIYDHDNESQIPQKDAQEADPSES